MPIRYSPPPTIDIAGLTVLLVTSRQSPKRLVYNWLLSEISWNKNIGQHVDRFLLSGCFFDYVFWLFHLLRATEQSSPNFTRR